MSAPGGFAYPGAQDPHAAPYSPGGGQTISPGAITYTTSTGPDGKVIYHPFRAVPASYQTPNGKVTGIQWVPAEATQMLPSGAQPATAEFAASWNRGHLNRDDEKALKQWQHDEDKRRRKEEKQSAKRVAQYERDRREREREEDQDLRGGYPTVSRRKSFVGPPSGPPGGGGGYANGYPTSPGGYAGSGGPDLTSRFGDMGIDGRGQGGYEVRNASSAYGPPPGPIHAPAATSGLVRPRKYSVGDQDRRRSVYGGSTSPYPVAAGGDSYPQSSAYPVAAAPHSGAGGSIYASTDASYPGAAATSGYPPTSSYTPAPGTAGEPYPRAASPYARAASPYGPRAPSPYARAASPYGPRAPSPYAAGGGMGTGASMGGGYGRSHTSDTQQARSRAPSPVGGGVYARGPISRAPSPINGGGGVYARGPISRAPSPMNGGGAAYGAPAPGFPQPGVNFPVAGVPSPNLGGLPALAGSGVYGAAPQPEQLAAPAGFSRPINAAQPYTPFDTIKVQDMDAFIDNMPKMPLVLQPHDVYHDDWIRLMQDLSLAWSGKLPIPEFARGGRPPKRGTLTADLVDLWNSSFFLARGVEVVLYKGAERRSGPNAGTIDRQIQVLDANNDYSDESSSTSSDTETSSSDEDGPRAGYGGEYGVYGRQQGGQMADYSEARLRQREKKKEKKRRHKEKKARKKAKARANKYAVYLTYVPRPGMAGSMGAHMSPAMGMGGGMPGGY